jgi:heme O synthase-like polyprenyltransferase
MQSGIKLVIKSILFSNQVVVTSLDFLLQKLQTCRVMKNFTFSIVLLFIVFIGQAQKSALVPTTFSMKDKLRN